MPRFFPRRAGADGEKNPRTEDLVQPDNELDQQYLSKVRARMMASHLVTVSATCAFAVGLIALSQGAWMMAWLMASWTFAGLWATAYMASTTYQWQKHDRDMRRDTERDYQIAIWDNMRLKENNDMLVQTVLLRDLSAAGAEADGDDIELSPSADVIFIDPLRRRDN